MSVLSVCTQLTLSTCCHRAGSGVLALPSAVASSGWGGAISIIICCIATAIAAIYLGRCWCIIESRYPEYSNGTCGHPYSIIGLKAVGVKTSHAVTVNVLAQLFGVSVVFLLLTSNLLFDILKTYHVQYLSSLTSCQWVIVVGLLSCPFMWLPSPAEITFIAYTAMSCTAVSCVLLLIIYSQQDWSSLPTPDPIQFEPFCLSLGTIAFAFGGTATFPTFQNFMKNRSHFPYAVVAGFFSEYSFIHHLHLYSDINQCEHWEMCTHNLSLMSTMSVSVSTIIVFIACYRYTWIDLHIEGETHTEEWTHERQ